jgi:hypothetical protein
MGLDEEGSPLFQGEERWTPEALLSVGTVEDLQWAGALLRDKFYPSKIERRATRLREETLWDEFVGNEDYLGMWLGDIPVWSLKLRPGTNSRIMGSALVAEELGSELIDSISARVDDQITHLAGVIERTIFNKHGAPLAWTSFAGYTASRQHDAPSPGFLGHADYVGTLEGVEVQSYSIDPWAEVLQVVREGRVPDVVSHRGVCEELSDEIADTLGHEVLHAWGRHGDENFDLKLEGLGDILNTPRIIHASIRLAETLYSEPDSISRLWNAAQNIRTGTGGDWGGVIGKILDRVSGKDKGAEGVRGEGGDTVGEGGGEKPAVLPIAVRVTPTPEDRARILFQGGKEEWSAEWARDQLLGSSARNMIRLSGFYLTDLEMGTTLDILPDVPLPAVKDESGIVTVYPWMQKGKKLTSAMEAPGTIAGFVSHKQFVPGTLSNEPEEITKLRVIGLPSASDLTTEWPEASSVQELPSYGPVLEFGNPDKVARFLRMVALDPGAIVNAWNPSLSHTPGFGISTSEALGKLHTSSLNEFVEYLKSTEGQDFLSGLSSQGYKIFDLGGFVLGLHSLVILNAPYIQSVLVGSHPQPGPEITTPEFKKFFGESKVVDNRGLPLVVVHSTFANFDAFARGDGAYHFGTISQAKKIVSPSAPNASLIAGYLRIENPLEVPDLGMFSTKLLPYLERNGIISRGEAAQVKYNPPHYGPVISGTMISKVGELLKTKGYDGLVYDNDVEGAGKSYAIFDPKQFKSVWNIGSFDREDPRFLFQGDELTPAQKAAHQEANRKLREGFVEGEALSRTLRSLDPEVSYFAAMDTQGVVYVHPWALSHADMIDFVPVDELLNTGFMSNGLYVSSMSEYSSLKSKGISADMPERVERLKIIGTRPEGAKPLAQGGEAWSLTLNEYLAENKDPEKTPDILQFEHRQAVQQAVNHGIAVPEENLIRYGLVPQGVDRDTAAEVARVEDEIDVERGKLYRLQAARFISRKPTEAEVMSDLRAFDAQGASNEELGRFRAGLRDTIRWISGLGSMISEIGHLKVVKDVILPALDNATEDRRSIVGLFENQLADVINGLTWADRRWLATVEEGAQGYSNGQRFLEEAGVPPELRIATPRNDNIAKYGEFVEQTRLALGEMAHERGVKQKFKRSWRTFIPATSKHAPRIPTTDFVRELLAGEGELYRAFVKAAVELNPDAFTTRGGERYGEKQVHNYLVSAFGLQIERKAGMLEEARKLRFLPDHIKVGDQWVAVFHAEPFEVMRQMVDRQAMRLAMVKQFGQNVERNIFPTGTKGQMTLRMLARILGVERQKKQEVVDLLVDGGVMTKEEIKGLKLSELKFILAAMGEFQDKDVRRTEAILNFVPGDLTPKISKKLIAIANRLGGSEREITTGSEALLHIKNRIENPVDMDIVEGLALRVAREGGASAKEAFHNILRVWQGLPYHWMSRKPLVRGMRLASDIIGSLQTFFSSVPNMVQTLAVVPSMTGLKNFLKAWETFRSNPNLAEAEMVALGACGRSLLVWGYEQGYGMEAWGRDIKQMVGQVTGLRKSIQANNVVAALAFREVANQWRSRGLRPEDVPLAETLLWTKEEIQKGLGGEVTERAWRKTIQNGVARTQYASEAPHRKGKIENIPLARMILAYSNYALGATRAAADVIRGFRTAWRSGDYKTLVGSSLRILGMVAGSIGAGFATELLRRAVKGQPEKEPDEKMFDQALRALKEVQLLGATQRMIDPFTYDGGIIDKALVGMMPQVKALTQVLGAVLGGYGRYGDFPMPRRLAEAVKNNAPLFRALSRWTDVMAYPELQRYEQARAHVRKYAKEVLGVEPHVLESKLNPEYYPTFLALQRGDRSGTREAAKEFFAKHVRKQGEDIEDVIRGLRQSLLSRQPIPLGEERIVGFLKTLSPEERQRIMKTQVKYRATVEQVAPSFGR